LATVSPASTAELDIELGSDRAAGWARRSGSDDVDESRSADGEGWDCAGRLAGRIFVVEDGSEDPACRSELESESVSSARSALAELGAPDGGGDCAEPDETAAAASSPVPARSEAGCSPSREGSTCEPATTAADSLGSVGDPLAPGVSLPGADESGVIVSGSWDIEGSLVVDGVPAGAAACGKELRDGRACCSSAATDVALSSRRWDGGVVAPEPAIRPDA
jgi:hypothetical protein